MHLSTRMRYGTRALLHLALHEEQGPCSVGEVAEALGLSAKYLEALLNALRRAGLVQSLRGAGGGYKLARSPEEITLRDAFWALEGLEGFVPCTTSPEACPQADLCVMQEVWSGLYATCLDFLASYTLADLARRARERQAGQALMYYL